MKNAKSKLTTTQSKKFCPNNERVKRGKYVEASKTNDASWYKAPQLGITDAVFNIPFDVPAGISLSMGDYGPWVHNEVRTWGASTAVGLRLAPYYGFSNNASDSLNVSAQQLYTYVRHVNSGSRNYDSPDLMVQMLGMADVISFISYAKRLYGFLPLYNAMNRAMPDALLKLNGINNPDELRSNAANYRYRLNLLIAKAASLAVPGTLSLFRRRAFAFANFYVEGPSIRDQIYMFVPEGFFAFDHDSDGAGMLRFKTLPLFNTIDELFAYGEALISNFFVDEDAGIITGDILKAYGENSLLKITPLDANYMVTPQYDIRVLNQMKNATIIDFTGEDLEHVLYVQQDTNKAYLKSGITVFASNEVHDFLPFKRDWKFVTRSEAGHLGYARMLLDSLGTKQLLSSESANPSMDDIIDDSRLMVAFKRLDPNSETYAMIAGADFVTRLEIATPLSGARPGTLPFHTYMYGHLALKSNTTSNEVGGAMTSVAALSNFHFIPRVSVFNIDTDNSTDMVVKFAGPEQLIWQVENYTILDAGNLERMHSAALMAMVAAAPISLG